MDSITVCTTFHKEGLDLYGQRFIDSFAKRVDKQIKLLVYAEDCVVVNPDPTQITVFDAKLELKKTKTYRIFEKVKWILFFSYIFFKK